MIAILTLADLQLRTGDSLRPILEAEGLMKNNFTDFVVYSSRPAKKKEFPQRTIDIFKLKNFPLPFQKIKFQERLVHAHQLSSVILKQDYVLDMHGFIYAEKRFAKGFRHIYTQLPIRLEAKLIKKAKRIICASNSVKQGVLNRFKDSDLQIDVVRNMVKPEDYVKTEQKDLVVGVIGPFTNRWGKENIRMLHEMLKKGKTDFEIRTIGKISQDQISLLKSFKNVRHLGFASDSGYKKFLKEISVLLLPFPKECSGGGSKNKLLEAAASSIPIVSTSVGSEGFDEKDALLIGETPEELTEKIKELESFNLREKFGNGLRRIIELNYNYKIETRKLIKIYEECP